MKIQVQSIHFDADVKLLEFIQEKVDKLDKFFDRIIDGEVYLKLDNAVNESNKIAELIINVPGNQIFSKHQCKTFEEAITLSVDSVKKQVVKRKEKLARTDV
ncbi:MAG: putative sigma-54 modulation protein [Sphingobacteriales bacterium]|jgi:putative sigma-54 modulation protein